MTETERTLKQLNDVNDGRRVALAWDVFRSLLELRKITLCSQITQTYRTSRSPQEVYDLVAALNAIEELEAHLKQLTQRGDRAGKEILDGGHRRN